MSELRKCKKCLKTKRILDFSRNKTSKGGRLNSCKECQGKCIKLYMKLNPECGKKACYKNRFGGNREIVLARDGNKCVQCGMTREQHQKTFKRDITVDHIDGRGRYSASKNHEIDNLQTLCLICHGKKDSKRSPYDPL